MPVKFVNIFSFIQIWWAHPQFWMFIEDKDVDVHINGDRWSPQMWGITSGEAIPTQPHNWNLACDPPTQIHIICEVSSSLSVNQALTANRMSRGFIVWLPFLTYWQSSTLGWPWNFTWKLQMPNFLVWLWGFQNKNGWKWKCQWQKSWFSCSVLMCPEKPKVILLTFALSS